MNFKKVLFKLNLNSQIQSWEIEVDGPKYRTSEGLLNGKITTSNWTYTKPKNIGKANYRDAEQQALDEAYAKITKKKEQGYYENKDDIYKGKQFLEPMLAHKYQDNKKLVDEHVRDYYCQPKLDGIRNVHSNQGSWSRKGKKFICIPYIEEEATRFLKFIRKNYAPHIIALDGELYNHTLKADFEKITSLVRKTKPSEEDIQESRNFLRYYIYDFIDPELSFMRRQSILRKAFIEFGDIAYLNRVPTHHIASLNDMNKYYEHYLKAGYEGQMLRLGDSKYFNGRTKFLLKRKEFQDQEASVLDIIEGVGNASGLAATALCKWDNGVKFSSSIMGSQAFRKNLLLNKAKVIGLQATIRFQNLTRDGKPRFPRLVEIRDYE